MRHDLSGITCLKDYKTHLLMEEHRSIQPVGQEQQSRLSPRVCNKEKAVWIQAARVPKLHPSHLQWDAEAMEDEALDSREESP